MEQRRGMHKSKCLFTLSWGSLGNSLRGDWQVEKGHLC
jgi:hypothetical protein